MARLVILLIVLSVIVPCGTDDKGKDKTLIKKPTDAQCEKVTSCSFCLAIKCVYSIDSKGNSSCVTTFDKLRDVTFIIFPEEEAYLACPPEVIKDAGSGNWILYTLLSLIFATSVGVFCLLLIRAKRTGQLIITKEDNAEEQPLEIEMDTL